MKAKQIDSALREADPASEPRMAGLEFGPAEAALAENILAEAAGDDPAAGLAKPWPDARRGRRLGLLGLATATAVVVVVVAVLALSGGGSGTPSRAYGAELSGSRKPRRCCCSKDRGGGSRTFTSPKRAKARKGRSNSSPAGPSHPKR